MTSNVLEKIVTNKRLEVEQRKKICSVQVLKRGLSPSLRSLVKALSSKHSDFIFECKKASPSKGLLRENFDLDEILASYKKYASAISVLTDSKYFQGSHKHLSHVCQSVDVPVLCKDFFIDSYQIFEARYYGADAILLMLSVLDDNEYKELATVANSLNLDILTEVHDEKELNRAISLGAKIIGINNRNLKDLSINLDTTERLLKSITEEQKNNTIFISESGIGNHQDVIRLSKKVNGFLVGSSIMEKQDIDSQCKELLFGRVKICGLTSETIAKMAEQSGASFGGLIFYPKSPRYICPDQALEIINSTSLKFVGVFVNYNFESLIEIATSLKLKILQLHGDEDSQYIAKLKKALPQVKIWKAIAINDQITEQQRSYFNDNNVNKIVIDTYHKEQKGGTGETFNWKYLAELPRKKIVLAGGLNISNIEQALELGTFAIDINSGVEEKPGSKSELKINDLFKSIRT